MAEFFCIDKPVFKGHLHGKNETNYVDFWQKVEEGKDF
jgi:hypothetical protein